MRIAMVTETYPPEVNGVARTIGLMAEGLQRRGRRRSAQEELLFTLGIPT